MVTNSAADWVWGVQLMSEVRYAFRVRGRNSDVVLTALQEGLDIEVAPTTTAMHGWLPDQAALFGMLARIRLLGLELLEIRRLPHGGQRVDSGHSLP
jgi:hypothetical protein